MKIFFSRKGIPEQTKDSLENLIHLKIILICSGSFSFRHKNRNQTLHGREMIIIPAGFTFSIFPRKSGQLKPNLITLQINVLSFAIWLSRTNNSIYFSLEVRLFKLREREFIYLSKILRWAYHYLNYHSSSGSYSLKNWLIEQLILEEIALLNYKKSINWPQSNSRKIKIASDFLLALEKNYSAEHKVSFYASLLCVSDGYLNKILKEITMKSAKQNIDEYILIQAKILLTNGNLTILQLSEELGFSSPSHFSNFFKKHEGIRPSQFREGLK